MRLALLGWMSLTGCVPFVLPPGRVEGSEGLRLGTVTPQEASPPPTPSKLPPKSDGLAETRVAAGVHLASLLEDPPFDAGVGYVFTDIGFGDRTFHGLYGEAGPFLRSSEYLRLFVGVHGEARFGDDGARYSLYGRLAGELHDFSTGASWERFVGGAHAGTTGFGWFVESGPQFLPGGEHAVVVAGGLWVRFPTVAALLCCVPGKVLAKAAGSALK